MRQAVSIAEGTVVVAAATGMFHSMALTSRGRLLVWGYNRDGQLGVGDSTDRLTPILNTFLPGNVEILLLSALLESFLVSRLTPNSPVAPCQLQN